MCRSGNESSGTSHRRCTPSPGAQDRQRRLRADQRQRAAQRNVTAYIGATPFRPESEALLAMSSRDSYYESDEWQEWSDRIHVLAERYNVDVVEGTPNQAHAEGLWLGETEPSGAYTVQGTPENIELWAAHVASQYDQDAVMVLYGDPDGPDTLYRFPVTDQEATQGVLAAMAEAGVPGGRITDGGLEIVSTRDDPVSPAALALIQERLGGDVTHSRVRAAFVEKDDSKTAHQPIKEIQAIRQRHAEKHGLPVRGPCPHLTDADDIAAAMAYQDAADTPENPKVKRSYAMFRRHLAEQHDALTAAGYEFSPWTGSPEMTYPDSAAMIGDLRDNKRLRYSSTEASQNTGDALPAGHPMNQMLAVHDKNGQEQRVLANDVFRAVHNTIAHSEGHQFGRHGKRMAWHTHRSSLPREAHLALWNETRAQDVWTSAGPHMRTLGDDGTPRLLRQGEPGWVPPSERPHAEHKCARVPASLT